MANKKIIVTHPDVTIPGDNGSKKLPLGEITIDEKWAVKLLGRGLATEPKKSDKISIS